MRRSVWRLCRRPGQGPGTREVSRGASREDQRSDDARGGEQHRRSHRPSRGQRCHIGGSGARPERGRDGESEPAATCFLGCALRGRILRLPVAGSASIRLPGVHRSTGRPGAVKVVQQRRQHKERRVQARIPCLALQRNVSLTGQPPRPVLSLLSRAADDDREARLRPAYHHTCEGAGQDDADRQTDEHGGNEAGGKQQALHVMPFC